MPTLDDARGGNPPDPRHRAPGEACPTPRISLVIPAYNEARYLPRLLASIEEARRAYARGAEAVEVIVADNASTDETASVAARAGARVVRVEKRAIAAARNGGARAARGSVLAFLDADTVRIDPRTFDEIDHLLASGRCAGGATGVRPERWSAGLAATFLLLMSVVWITGMDTGVVFCRREDFEAVGGYDESRLLAEDVAFLWALRRLGRSRGRRLVRARSVKAVASTRKFDEHGDWHYFTRMPLVPLRMALRRGVARDEDLRYWYAPRR